MKSVRVNANTIILVNKSIPDNEARERYLKRYSIVPKAPETYMPPKIKEDIQREIPVGSMEELGSLVEDMEALADTE
jgi:hypothetical protein